MTYADADSTSREAVIHICAIQIGGIVFHVRVPLQHRRFLDPRDARAAAEQPILDAVNIPVDELPERTHELPPRSETINVAASNELYARTANVLARMERRSTHIRGFQFGTGNADGHGRLWRPSPIVEQVAPALSPGPALDVGCGTGRDAVYLAALGWQVKAIDHLPDALDRGRRLSRVSGVADSQIEWTLSDAADALITLDGSFDLAIFVRFFQIDSLRNVMTRLNPGGSVIVDVFCADNDAPKFGRASKPVVSEYALRQEFREFELRELSLAKDERERRVLRAWACKTI